MHRRTFVIGTVASLSAPAGIGAQGPAHVPIVGIITVPPYSPDSRLEAFRQGLRDLGYVEGGNVRLEIRQWDGISGHTLPFITELIQMPVDVLVLPTTGDVIIAKRATTTIPIVATTAGALVETGAVASLARPGGNVTGLTGMQPDLARKRLDLLKDALPRLSRVSVFLSPYRQVPALGERLVHETEQAARELGLRLHIIRVDTEADLEPAFQVAIRERSEAGDVIPSPFWGAYATRVGGLALRYRLPLSAQDPGIVEAGGLMRYGINFSDLWRRAASYVDKILKGAKPAELPVEQPTKFELVINLKTAKALGLTVPPAVLARADEVIQ